jgi:hypothetical protein
MVVPVLSYRAGGVYYRTHHEAEFLSLHDYPPFQELLEPKG